ncbi:hypothetical protein DFH07DRAFT_856994 [Mycena maculata]|uniref:Uncharacterized protein n=1 Tax=Mycena maculata TaxID=230809 RepID=A0AAD7HK08_9AGAR|nr:hypothetical protein DFH07DRAFT_856994 [Mycena maculata]
MDTQDSLPGSSWPDVLLCTIHHHLALETTAPVQGTFSHQQLSADLLLALSTSLASFSQFSASQLLPQVLNRSIKWRVLPREERISPCALGAVVADLARLADSLDPPPSRKLQIVWIGYHIPRKALPNRRLSDIGATLSQIESLDTVPSHHEMAAYRSGCSACRTPRDTLSRRLHHHPSCAYRDTENIPPSTKPPPLRSTSTSKTNPHRVRAATVNLGIPVSQIPRIPRRNTTSVKPLPPLSNSNCPKPAISAPRATSTSVIAYPLNKPRPWPLPEPRSIADSNPTAASRPRVALGCRNAPGS